jgi:hypothetical protein
MIALSDKTIRKMIVIIQFFSIASLLFSDFGENHQKGKSEDPRRHGQPVGTKSRLLFLFSSKH